MQVSYPEEETQGRQGILLLLQDKLNEVIIPLSEVDLT